ncbi:DNA-binding response OmpR family regulator [Streptosporangium becharense]|uniref:DNA-binding response OmpR family regulator n=1 Tax=Streptosporangium becharense TaxID=1816182 RepID=A0A7W9MGS5_9ACTN|nr:response regulator transcription factor [Streptosporangium becharense]MBB2908817.1 DNA-binding response OmpR family regulator [Streptosporangium becharense]MBB5820165.1 DNA-binding response OmpR family regulator [Streptosporangium becharense]
MIYGSLGGMRVLLVEDERRLAQLLKDGLAGEGFAVDIAHDGRDGLWMATENAYDVIVLDVMLPRMNGYTVCARLRDAENWTPILVLTAKDGVHDEAEALDTGADDFLSKPFSYVVLLARLRALVRRGGRARPVSITVGDLVVDPAGLRCRRGEVEVSLTPKEFAVLHGLARRPGEVVSKSELLAQAWDFSYDGDPNIVEVYISALRRKIDSPFGRSSLVTVRGAGYRLEA